VLASGIDLVLLATPPGSPGISRPRRRGKHLCREAVAVDPQVRGARRVESAKAKGGVAVMQRRHQAEIAAIERTTGASATSSPAGLWNQGGLWSRVKEPAGAT
jgi:hypothetical protein